MTAGDKVEYVIVYFPPEAPRKERKFRNRKDAEDFAASDDIQPSAPLMIIRKTSVREEWVQLTEDRFRAEGERRP